MDARVKPAHDAVCWATWSDETTNGQPFYFPSNNQPNFSFALRATSALGVLVGGNLSRQAHGRQASMIATECVMSPLARFSGDSAGSAGESHEPSMNWIECLGSVRV